MAHHKKRKSRNCCAGCKLCKPWKIEGISKESSAAEKFSDHRRRKFAAQAIKSYLTTE